jgi:hypothetical protein
LRFLNKQIHFVSSFNQKVVVALILGAFLSMLILFLESFNTNEYESDNRTLLLLAFGGILSFVSIIQSSIENFWYTRLNKVWLVSHEIVSTLIFFACSGTLIYLYNHIIINEDSYSLASHWWYYSHIVLAMTPIIAPVLIFLRQKFGKLSIATSPNTITITGENKNETLELQKDKLLYIQAIENYIDIYFINTQKKLTSKTFRQTLSKVHNQVRFLEKCHRSYLVNINTVKEIQGNSQRAKLSFDHTETKIPVSKTLYKIIKAKVI